MTVGPGTAGLTGMPIVQSPFLDHGTMLATPNVVLVGTMLLDRAERIRRAARHEARLAVLAAARDLGHDAPDPESAFEGRLPADGLQVLDEFTGRWGWLDLTVELDAQAAHHRRVERDRRDREVLEAIEDWKARPWVVVGHPGLGYLSPELAGMLFGRRRVELRPFPRHSDAVLRGDPTRATVRDLPGHPGFVYADLA